MRLSSFLYLIKEGVKNLWFNRLMSSASIGVLTACLFLIGASLLFAANVNVIVGYVEDQNEVVIFLIDNLSETDMQDVDDMLRNNSNLMDLTFVSKEEGLLEKREQLGEIFDVLMEDNPLPDLYKARLRDVSLIDETILELVSVFGVLQVEAPRELAKTLTNIRNVVAMFGMSIVIILAAVSFIIVANTIRITVHSRRKEINIMKYVGATDMFIRFPFMIEGMLIGTISAFISYGLLWMSYVYLLDFISQSTSSWVGAIYDTLIPFDVMAPTLILCFLSAGLIMGLLGSMLFTRKYLKV
jgi:cell division transport system permease protein